MTDEQRSREGDEEAIEDLEAPAAVQRDVAGGSCIAPSCIAPDTQLVGVCIDPTCKATALACAEASHVVVVAAK